MISFSSFGFVCLAIRTHARMIAAAAAQRAWPQNVMRILTARSDSVRSDNVLSDGPDLATTTHAIAFARSCLRAPLRTDAVRRLT
jgi:hypothetical protein